MCRLYRAHGVQGTAEAVVGFRTLCGGGLVGDARRDPSSNDDVAGLEVLDYWTHLCDCARRKTDVRLFVSNEYFLVFSFRMYHWTHWVYYEKTYIKQKTVDHYFTNVSFNIYNIVETRGLLTIPITTWTDSVLTNPRTPKCAAPDGAHNIERTWRRKIATYQSSVLSKPSKHMWSGNVGLQQNINVNVSEWVCPYSHRSSIHLT